jgi:hypothetical protein
MNYNFCPKIAGQRAFSPSTTKPKHWVAPITLKALSANRSRRISETAESHFNPSGRMASQYCEGLRGCGGELLCIKCGAFNVAGHFQALV